MRWRAAFAAALIIFLGGCGEPTVPTEPAYTTVEKHTIVIVGGTPYGLTLAASLKEYDAQMDVALVEPEPFYVTEPFVNLYLVNKMAGDLVAKEYARIAKEHGYVLINQAVTSMEERRVVLGERIIEAKMVIDARFREGRGALEWGALQQLRKQLADASVRSVLIRSDAIPEANRARISELSSLVRFAYPRKKLALDPEGEIESKGFDLVVEFPKPVRPEGFHATDNYFAQYNAGLEKAAEMIKALFNGNFQLFIVSEDAVMLNDPQLVKGVDLQTKQPVDATDYLAKVYRVNRYLR